MEVGFVNKIISTSFTTLLLGNELSSKQDKKEI